MMADDMWGPPSACGKRPRSPVDKLADLAASADDDEQDWRSSKRYLTEVIASGFSKLSFKLGMPHQQQQQLAGAGLEAGQQPLQHQGSISPRTFLPGQLGLPAAQHLQLPDGDCPMDMQESLSPPKWPPQQPPLHKPPFLAPSPGSASGTGGLLGAWAQHGDGAVGQQQQQHGIGPPAAVCAGHRTPSPEPCSCAALASSPRGQAAPAADASSPCSGCGTAAAAAAAGVAGNAAVQGGVAGAAAGDEAGSSSNRPGLPPLQTAKVIRAAEKQPASPSDLPAASLRKVALLRSLLARAEQQFQQQQGAAGQQQQGVGAPQPAPQQQSRMAQPGFAGTPPPSCTTEQQQDAAPAAPQQQHPQQQQEGVDASSSRLPWMQPWGALSGSSTAPPALQGSFHQGRGQQPLLPVLPPRPVTPWDMSSDDMDCSSASSVVESDSSSQQGPGGAGLMQQASFDGDQDQAASTLLCQELLFPGEDECPGGQDPPVGVGAMQGQPEQQERSYCSSRGRHNMQLPFYQAATEQPLFGPAGPPAAAPAEALSLQGQQQQQQLLHHPTLPPLQSAGSSSAAGGPPPPHRQGRRSSGNDPLAPGKQGGSSPELSRHRLDELRAKALASTRQLTCLTQEDLHSLQLGLASPRRGSVDSSHAPSGLQHEGTRGLSPPPALRRHSSHI